MQDLMLERTANNSVEWALRYLERLELPFDHWQIDYFRRGCGFLARNVVAGAASTWETMHLPEERRREVYSGPMVVHSLTRQEVDRIRSMLTRIASGGPPQEAGNGRST